MGKYAAAPIQLRAAVYARPDGLPFLKAHIHCIKSELPKLMFLINRLIIMINQNWHLP